MKWFKENKFLGGLIFVTLLAGGALGYLMYTAKGKYDESVGVFNQQANELSRLEHLAAYPDKQNLEILEAQRIAHLNLIADLQKNLAASVVPIEPTSPNGFQEQLRQAVTQFTARATATGIKMTYPKGFYLGFEQYQNTAPSVEAAPVLSQELKVVQKILQILLDRGGRVSELKTFNRDLLAEEGKGAKATEPPKKAPARRPGEKAAPAVEPLVKSHGLDLTFFSDQFAFREVLKAVVENKEQFLITRYLTVHNSMERPPDRDPSDPGKPPEKDPVIVGNEKLEISMRLEIVDFARPVVVETPISRGNRTSGN